MVMPLQDSFLKKSKINNCNIHISICYQIKLNKNNASFKVFEFVLFYLIFVMIKKGFLITIFCFNMYEQYVNR